MGGQQSLCSCSRCHGCRVGAGTNGTNHGYRYDGQARLLLLPPSMVFLLGHCQGPADAAAIATPLELDSRELVVMPINDNDDVGRGFGGFAVAQMRASIAFRISWHRVSLWGVRCHRSPTVAFARGGVSRVQVPSQCSNSHARGWEDECQDSAGTRARRAGVVNVASCGTDFSRRWPDLVTVCQPAFG